MGDSLGQRADPDWSVLLPGTSNTRPVGGFRTVDGRTMRQGMLYRAEVLGPLGSGAESVWTDEHADAYRGMGLQLVVDLRSDREILNTPTAWADGTGARLHQAPIPEGVEGSDTDFMGMLLDGLITSFNDEQLGQWYADLVDRRADVIGSVVRELAAADNFPALIHCQQGKDRTGIVIAIILEALGVPRDEVVHDYTLTSQFRPGRAEKNVDLIEKLGLQIDDIRTFWEAPKRTMEITLEHLDSEYGGAVGYLVGAGGVTVDEVGRFRSQLLN